MKHILPLLLVVALAACNDGQVDKLKKEIDDIHIVGMSKMGRLNKLQQATQNFIDSLSNVGGEAREAALELRAKADSVLNDLNYADYAMNTWMSEFYSHGDTLANKKDELLKYLELEKEKSSKVTDAILNGIRKAEDLLDGR